MCMGGGGGGGGGSSSAAKINTPTQKEYRDIQKVVDKLYKETQGLLSPKNSLNQAYSLLQSSNAGLQRTLQESEKLSTMAANNQLLLAQDAARLAALKGPPPPEKTADAPLIGAQREPTRTTAERGRSSLRIDRTTPSLTL